jgi:hypothetical protein
VASLGAGAALAVLLYLPAALVRLFTTTFGKGRRCASST